MGDEALWADLRMMDAEERKKIILRVNRFQQAAEDW